MAIYPCRGTGGGGGGGDGMEFSGARRRHLIVDDESFG